MPGEGEMMDSAAPCLTEQRERAVRHLCRQVASQILAAMCYRCMEPEDIDAALQWKPGTARRSVRLLADGRGARTGMRVLADFAVALDVHVTFQLREKEVVTSAYLPHAVAPTSPHPVSPNTPTESQT